MNPFTSALKYLHVLFPFGTWFLSLLRLTRYLQKKKKKEYMDNTNPGLGGKNICFLNKTRWKLPVYPWPNSRPWVSLLSRSIELSPFSVYQSLDLGCRKQTGMRWEDNCSTKLLSAGAEGLDHLVRLHWWSGGQSLLENRKGAPPTKPLLASSTRSASPFLISQSVLCPL